MDEKKHTGTKYKKLDIYKDGKISHRDHKLKIKSPQNHYHFMVKNSLLALEDHTLLLNSKTTKL